MTQFFAILKDSFREAVDGFVIYVMLGIASLVILIVGSMSFTPAEPAAGMDTIVRKFSLVFPDKGRSRVIAGSFETTYAAEKVSKEADGYKLQLKVTARSGSTLNGKHDPKDGDSFRRTVAAWSKQPGRTMKAKDIIPKKDNKDKDFGKPEQKTPDVEVTFELNATPEEQLAVDAAMMEDFLRNQFAVHAGMTATVKRVTEGTTEPTYLFEVSTTGGAAVRGWPHTLKIFFGTVTLTESATLGQTLYVIEDQIINGLGAAITLLMGLIFTSFFIPNMLRKGSVDLLLSKPIGRSTLLIYKYIGGLTFMLLVTAFTVGGIWFVLGLRSGYWDPRFLALIPILTFTFAIVYAVSTTVAVFTRSPIAAMILSIGFMVFLFIVGQVKTIFDTIREANKERMPDWAYTVVDTLNNVMPRYKDLDKLTSKMISDGTLTDGERRMFGLSSIQYASWEGTVGVSLAFIILMLVLSCWRFNKRDN